MATVADEAALNLYQSIVEEIMVRLHGVQSLVSGPTILRPAFVREYGYLQLRICCELVALACLVCHGDIKAAQTKRIEKAYVPAEILNQLEKLHPDFYPVPVIQNTIDNSVRLDEFTDEYLTKDDLLKLWSRTGSILHKGNLRGLLKNNVNHRSSADFTELVHDMQMMINLINTHRISRKGGHFLFLINMNIVGWASSSQVTINVFGAIAEAPPLLPL